MAVDAEHRAGVDALALAALGGHWAGVVGVIWRPVVAAGVGYSEGMVSASVAAGRGGRRWVTSSSRGRCRCVGAAPHVLWVARRIVATGPAFEVGRYTVCILGAVGYGCFAAVIMSRGVALEKGVHLVAGAVRAGRLGCARCRPRWRWRRRRWGRRRAVHLLIAARPVAGAARTAAGWGAGH